MSAKTLSHLGAVAMLGLILAELTIRLPAFPGLHGDEAWVGLDALAIGRRGFTTLQGMNAYTGALYSQIVAAQFSFLGASVFSLRLPGALCNWLAVTIVAATLWNRRHAAFFAMLLFASSLLFLFYSRVAWEVSALQNLLLALALAALNRLLQSSRAAPGWTFLFFFAFALGVWNHFIFLAAAVSLVLAAAFLMLRRPDRGTARVLALALFNLALQGILMAGKLLTPGGPFATHALPAIIAALALLMTTSIAFEKLEPGLSSRFIQILGREPKLARRIGIGLASVTAAGFLFSLPLDGVSFFGTLSGLIMGERVAAHIPSWPEAAFTQAAMAILISAFAVLAYRFLRPARGDSGHDLTRLLLLWTVLFFPALRLETPHAPDRYFIIPQFLFFCALALAMQDLPLFWRRGLQCVMALFFLYGQSFFWRAVLRGDDGPPLDFHYGLYDDTSRHFLKLAPLRAYLADRGLCSVQSSSYFIGEPLHFLLATGPSCKGNAGIRIEYCDSCRSPVAWFGLTARPAQSDTASSRRSGEASTRKISGPVDGR